MSKQSQEVADEVQKEIEEIEALFHTSIKPNESIICNRCGDEYCPGTSQCNRSKKAGA